MELLIHAYTCKQYGIIPIDLVKIICDYEEFVFDCLSVPFYPALTITLGKLAAEGYVGVEGR